MSAPKKENSFIAPIHNPIYGNTSLWLLKPADLNRGRGIHLFRTIEELGNLLRNDLNKHEKGSFLIQKYIEKPMLINNRKFDIRVYSLITQSK
jgi:tubulin monoglycylase TTLL3/8